MVRRVHRRDQRRSVHPLRNLRAAAFAAVTLTITTSGWALASGCGGPAEETARVDQAADRSGQISRLKKEAQRLRENRRTTPPAEPTGGDKVDNGKGSLNSLVTGLAGRAGVVISGPGGSQEQTSGGKLTTGAAWSTIKVPIAQRVLEDAGGTNGFGADVLSDVTAAITLSDNDAAAALFERLKEGHGGLVDASAAVQEVLRAAGDGTTTVSTRGRDGFSTYGQTEWSLAAQNRYMAALAGGCVGDAAVRRFLLDQMSSVRGSDTFGLGATGLPSKWKGGWGPGADGKYLVRQMGVVETARGPVVIAMAAIPDDGTFESGTAMLSEIATRAVARFTNNPPSRSSC